MSSIARPPDPCLAAIVLIVRLRAGPRFVFHYPPSPSPAFPSPPSTKRRRRSRAKSTSGKSSDSTTPTSDEGSSSEDEDGSGSTSAAAAGKTGSTASAGTGTGVGEKGLKSRRSDWSLGRTSPSPLHGSVSASSASSVQRMKTDAEVPTTGGATSAASSTDPAGRRSDSGHGKGLTELADPPWENFLGLKTNVWEKLLCPTPAWHKRRFEVGLNDLTFVGWPVFARENGMWRKRRTKRKKRAEESEDSGAAELEAEKEAGSSVTSPQGSELANLFDSTEALKSGKEKEKEKEKLKETAGEDSKGEMTMFNVVFVLNPPILEYHLRVKEKYENVIKKFGKGLKSEQARADYVWTEVQKVLHIKEKARESGTYGRDGTDLRIGTDSKQDCPFRIFIQISLPNRP